MGWVMENLGNLKTCSVFVPSRSCTICTLAKTYFRKKKQVNESRLEMALKRTPKYEKLSTEKRDIFQKNCFWTLDCLRYVVAEAC